MKKAIASIITLIVLLTCLVVPSKAYIDDSVSVYLDGNKLTFDIDPCIINNRTFVPVRGVLEAAGASVSWDKDTRTTVVSKGNTTVWISVDFNYMAVQKDGVSYVSGFEVAPCIIQDRTFIPIKPIAEVFDMTVGWDALSRSVLITTSEPKVPSVITLSGFEPPVTTTVGMAYSIFGDVSANMNLDRLNIKVKDSATGNIEINETVFDIDSSLYSLADIDSRIRFGTLSAGQKVMEITAVTQDESRQAFTYSFEVLKPEGAKVEGDVTMLWPVPSSGLLTTIFWCDNPACHSNAGRIRGHAAIDIAAPENADVIAVKDGVVLKTGYGDWENGFSGYGNFILVDHGNGLTTQYSHLFVSYVQEGDVVTAGQIIGGVGNTGNSTGNHLDFNIEQDGERCDPLYYLEMHPDVKIYEECDIAYFNVAMEQRGLPTIQQ